MVYNTGKKKNRVYLTFDALLQIVKEHKNDRPNYGAILIYYRLLAGWTAERLAILYSEALGLSEDKAITASWIYMMENNNSVPTDKKRRWILARLLNIPPILFGLEPLSDILTSQQNESLLSAFSTKKIDIVEYQSVLEDYTRHGMTGKTHELIPAIQQRIQNLHGEIHYSSSLEKPQMIRLLCGYLIGLAEIAHQQMLFDLTISLINRVIALAKQNKVYDIWAYALRQRGVAHTDKGELLAGETDFATAKPYFIEATANFDAARNLETHLSPQIIGLIKMAAGTTYTWVAQDQKQIKDALLLIDQGAKLIGKGGDDFTFSARFDEERYHLDKGVTLLVSPLASLRSPKAARREIELALSRTNSAYKMRHLENHLRQAESYFVEENYAMTTSYLEQALDSLKLVESNIRFTRLYGLYNKVRQSPYGSSDDVAQLGIELLKMQKPEMFMYFS